MLVALTLLRVADAEPSSDGRSVPAVCRYVARFTDFRLRSGNIQIACNRFFNSGSPLNIDRRRAVEPLQPG